MHPHCMRGPGSIPAVGFPTRVYVKCCYATSHSDAKTGNNYVGQLWISIDRVLTLGHSPSRATDNLSITQWQGSKPLLQLVTLAVIGDIILHV